MKKFLWFFDFDGTISPVVPDRTMAELDPDCRSILQELALKPDHLVAVISSRSYEDLSMRLPLHGIYLGAASGLVWAFPDGSLLQPYDELKLLETARKPILSSLYECANLPGVELEDKWWSAALHYGGATPQVRELLALHLETSRHMHKVSVFAGPDAYEVQFLQGIDKKYGVSRLCDSLGINPYGVNLFYAGDDENDATAVEWVIAKEGRGVSVGPAPLVPGSIAVADPRELAAEVRRLADL